MDTIDFDTATTVEIQVEFLRLALYSNLIEAQCPDDAAEYIARNLTITHSVDELKPTPFDLEIIAIAMTREFVQTAGQLAFLNSVGLLDTDITDDHVALAKLVIEGVTVDINEEGIVAAAASRNSSDPEVQKIVAKVEAMHPMYGVKDVTSDAAAVFGN
jgi:serine protease inhibitor